MLLDATQCIHNIARCNTVHSQCCLIQHSALLNIITHVRTSSLTQVLLGLSDTSIVSLSGQPVWFTVCPQDPNTPSLPPPFHGNKQHGYHNSMEYIFSKLKQKAWLFGGSLSVATVKHSTSLTNDLHALGLDVGPRGGAGPGGGKTGSADSSPRPLRKGTSQYGQEFLQTLKCEMEREGTAASTAGGAHTINEAKLAKLHSILNVLRDDAEDSGTDSSPDQQPQLPEFLDIFESPGPRGDSKMPPSNSNVKKRHPSTNGTAAKKRKKRSRALMHVLRGNLTDASSDSGDNFEKDRLSSSLNEQSAAWLRSRKATGGLGGGRGIDNSRPRSDSFQTIPKLRESLNAGKRNTVSTYDFDEQRGGTRSRPRKASQSGLVHRSDDGHSHGERGSVVASTGADSAGARGGGGQLLYQMVVVEDDTPSPSPASHQDYSVPVEVSLHRINVTDVDKPAAEEEIRSKSFSMSRPLSHGDVVDSGGGGEGEGTGNYLLTMKDKARSRSLGDVMSTDDEVLVVRTPVHLQSPAVERRRTHFVRTSMPVGPAAPLPAKTHPPRRHSNEGEEFTSLDFTSTRVIANGGRKGKDVFRSSRQSCDLIQTSWEYNDQVGMVTGKSKSLDDLLEAAGPVLR